MSKTIILTEHKNISLKSGGSSESDKPTIKPTAINIKNAITNFTSKINKQKESINPTHNQTRSSLGSLNLKDLRDNFKHQDVNEQLKRSLESGNLDNIELFQPMLKSKTHQGKIVRQESKKDAYIYKTYKQKNRPGGPIFYLKEKREPDHKIKDLDAFTMEQINKKVEKRFNFSKSNERRDDYNSYKSYDTIGAKKLSIFNPNKTTASSLYVVLNKKKNDFIEELHRLTTEKNFYNHKKDASMDKVKQEYFKQNDITHFLEKKTKNNMPIIFPLNNLHDTIYQSLSEKTRFAKLTKAFSNLRYYVENNEDNELQIVKEFIIKNEIFDQKYLSIDRLNNFLRFIKSDYKLDPNKTVQQTIKDALLGIQTDVLNQSVENIESKMGQTSNTLFMKTRDNYFNKTELLKLSNSNSTTKIKVNESSSLNSSSSKMRMPVEISTRYDFQNKPSVITKIENEFVNMNFMNKEDTTMSLFNNSNNSFIRKSNVRDMTSESMINRMKRNDEKMYFDKLTKIKKKKRLTDFIILQRTKNLFFLDEAEKTKNQEDLLLL